MADSEKRIAVISPDGQFGTISAKHAEAIIKAGGRVLTKEETSARVLEDAYANRTTEQKVVGALTGDVDPTLTAYHRGAVSGLTAGLGEAAIAKGADVFAPGAGKAYAEAGTRLEEAHPIAHGVGEGVGLVGGAAIGSAAGSGAAGLAAKALPSAGIGAVGGAVEAAVAGSVEGLAARGAMGRAAATALELGARGATEGALYGIGQASGDALLHDVDGTADKILASGVHGALWGAGLGAGLGAAGSLAKSALGGLGGVSIGAEGLLSKVSDDGVRDLAHDRAWRTTSGRKAFAAEANARLPGGTNDVGEAMLRHGVISAEEGIGNAAANYATIAERVGEPLSTVGAKIGDIVDASGAVVPAAKIAGAVDAVAQPLGAKAGFGHIEGSVIDYGMDLLKKLGVTDPAGSVSVKDLIYQRRALDELIYKEAKALDPGGRVGALREVRGNLEGVIEGALDDASGKVAGELRAEYKALKHDYQALSIAQRAADDAVTRGAANRTFSLTDKIIGATVGGVGATIGGPIGGLVAGPGAAAVSKVVRERADAVMALTLKHIADSGVVSRLVGKVDQQISKAATGLLAKPPVKALPAPEGAPRLRAQAAMVRIAAMQADPEGTSNRIARQTEALNATSPELAAAMGTRMAQSLSFLAEKMPAQADRDPLDPHPRPQMTDAEAATFARYVWYTEKPSRFFEEVAHGKLTPEGAETAQRLMPRAFAELQERVADAIATHMAHGRSIPFQQRLVIGSVLNFPAVPAQRVDHMLTLQRNVVPSPQDLQSQPAPSRRSAGKSTQRSALDRLEESGPGR